MEDPACDIHQLCKADEELRQLCSSKLEQASLTEAKRRELEEKMSKVSFLGFPSDPAVKRKWIVAIRRDEGKFFSVSQHTKVCSKHFADTDFYASYASGIRLLKEGAVPGIFNFPAKSAKPPRKPPKNRSMSNSEVHMQQPLEQYDEAAVTGHDTNAPAELGIPNAEVHVQQPVEEENATAVTGGASAEPDITCLTVFEVGLRPEDVEITIDHENELRKELLEAQPELKALKEKLNARELELQKAKDVEREQKATKEALFRVSRELELAKETSAKLEKKVGRQFSIDRFKHSEDDMRFYTGLPSYAVFKAVLNYLNPAQQPLWMSKERVQEEMPPEIKETYSSTRVILDAAEIKCHAASSLALQSATFSTYKSANTFKGLVGISPDGTVTFVSNLFPGSISDKECMRQSGFLTLPFDDGDVVMADKGFIIQDMLNEINVGLNTPPCLRGHFSEEEIRETEEIASLRIHVERQIQRIKCFHIFDRPIPLSLGPVINQMWIVCAILTNFQSPLIRPHDA
ncbi:uncharacterized protein LOC135395967 [Ornithodoros turicata]|uniref:uncharacterized protein LOC135395967 n=1 Tax=Ornithodoros turicata TaxID=34597 RepID=UPI00313A4961